MAAQHITNLVEAALDQPNPTQALKDALRVTLRVLKHPDMEVK
jgi:hypothetical protein